MGLSGVVAGRCQDRGPGSDARECSAYGKSFYRARPGRLRSGGHTHQRPAVSVVLPTFNRLQYLRPAVDSVFAQTFTDWELIVADAGSEDETGAYSTAFAAH